MKRKTLRAMYPLALFRGYTQQPKPKQRKQKPKERCWLKEILRNIWNRGRLSVGEAERLLSQSGQSWSHKTSKRDEEKMQMVWGKGLWFSPFWSVIVLFLPVSFSSNFFFSSLFYGCNVTIVNLNKKPNQNKVSKNCEADLPCSVENSTASWPLKILLRAVTHTHKHWLINGHFEDSVVGICVWEHAHKRDKEQECVAIRYLTVARWIWYMKVALILHSRRHAVLFLGYNCFGPLIRAYVNSFMLLTLRAGKC